MADLIARALAHGDEHQQAAFFNAFFRDLAGICKAHDSGGQLHYITRNLDGVARTAIIEWADEVKHESEQDGIRNAAHSVDVQRACELRREVAALEARKDVLVDEVARLAGMEVRMQKDDNG